MEENVQFIGLQSSSKWNQNKKSQVQSKNRDEYLLRYQIFWDMIWQDLEKGLMLLATKRISCTINE